MFISLEIKFPMDAIVAVKDAAKLGDDDLALSTVHFLTDQTVLDAIKQLPFDFVPKAVEGEEPATSSNLKRPSSTMRSPSPPVKKVKTDPENFQTFVKTHKGETYKLEVTLDTKISALKKRLEDCADVALSRKQLLRKGRRMLDDDTIADYGIEDGDTIWFVAVDERLLGTESVLVSSCWESSGEN